MILATAKEVVVQAAVLSLTIGLPAFGLVVSIAGLQRRGLNRKAGVAACLLFGTLIIQGTTTSLTMSDGISERTQIIAFAATAAINCLSALIAVMAIWEIRRKNRWPRGRKRAIIVVWLNIGVLVAISAHFFFRINPSLADKFWNG